MNRSPDIPAGVSRTGTVASGSDGTGSTGGEATDTGATGIGSTGTGTDVTGTRMRRQTRQRAAVAGVLDGLDDFRSAQALHALLRERGDTVGLTTVYRTLAALAHTGEVDVLVGEDGEALYRRCSDGHHHHLVCRDCGRTVEVAGPAVESWARHEAAAHGYADVTHTLEIFGVCAACQETGSPTS